MKRESRRRVEITKRWPAGCAAPPGYVDWHEWAEAQHLQGLAQRQCTECGRWKFPQQLGATTHRCNARPDCDDYIRRFGKLKLRSRRVGE